MTAVTLAGVVTVTSDGVTVVREAAVLSGIDINDGEPCNMTGTQHYMITMFNCNLSRLISVVCVMFEVENEYFTNCISGMLCLHLHYHLLCFMSVLWLLACYCLWFVSS